MTGPRPPGRIGRWSFGTSLGVHGLLALAIVTLHGPPPAGPAREGREYRIEVAREDPLELTPEQPEPERELPPLEEELPPPELLPQDVVAEEQPAEEAPPELDDSFALRDPLERVTETAWAERTARVEPQPVEAAPRPAPPPTPTPSPAEAPREFVPVVLEDPAPRYPRSAQRLGLEGSVQLRARVSRDGSVHSVEIVSSSGHAILDDAARDKLYEWRFRPWQPGEPEERSFLKTFTFRMPR